MQQNKQVWPARGSCCFGDTASCSLVYQCTFRDMLKWFQTQLILVSQGTFYYCPIFAIMVLCLYIFLLDSNMNYERKQALQWQQSSVSILIHAETVKNTPFRELWPSVKLSVSQFLSHLVYTILLWYMPDFLKRNLRSSCHHNFFVQQTGSSLEDCSQT